MEEDMGRSSIDVDGFLFPFNPYPGQIEFCHTLYDAVLAQKLAILESPTGTGKSMAIIASALRWLSDEESKYRDNYDNIVAEEEKLANAENWLEVADKRRKLQDAVSDLRIIIDWLSESDKLAKESRKKMDELISKLDKKDGFNYSSEKKAVDEYIAKESDLIGNSSDEEVDDENVDPSKESNSDNAPVLVPQIIYASRTHSQISQFVSEINRHPIKVRLVPLGARQMLCINDRVRSNNSSSWLVNDRCAELRKQSGNRGCRYYNSKRIAALSNVILGETTDIEDLASLGRSVCACPYYAARRAIPRTEVIVAPYPLLFQASARESSGIRLSGSVIIIDEAHNLLEHLGDSHAARIDQNQLQAAHKLITAYWDKYSSRLNAINARMVRQLTTMVNALLDHLSKNRKDEAKKDLANVFKVEEFAFSAGAEAINLPALVRWAKEVRIGQKVRSFSSSLFSSLTAGDDDAAAINKEVAKDKKLKPKTEEFQSVSHASALCQVLSFLETLGNLPNAVTRVIVTEGNEAEKKPSSIHVLLLDPASQFAHILKEARSVVLAGGTMQPVGDLLDQLKCTLPNLEVVIKQFPHVIPPDSLMVVPVSSGPSGCKMRFTFAARQDNSALKEAGKALASLMPLVPHGFVIFFPSYDLMSSAIQIWKQEGTIERLEKKKKIFLEPRNARHGIEQFLEEYGEMAKSPQGAILLAVMGGKMSEGVNLSDDLARGLAVLGMPYPSLASVELQEKLKYLSSLKSSDTSVEINEGIEKDRGRRYYTSLCWRSINQTVGRCIRHAGDHAVVFLIDERYSAKSTLDANLPPWMAESVHRPAEGAGSASFGTVVSSIAAFFRKRRIAKLNAASD